MTEIVTGKEVAGRFVITEALGEGGMGRVYRALQTSLDREVALKLLHAQAAFTPRARRRFAREARSVARLNHPHIAAVFDFGTDNDDQTLWLAMELVEGRPMTQLKREPIDLLFLVTLSDQICSALSAAHARGIIHRDLKPSNVLVSQDDTGRPLIKLVDFGLATTLAGDISLENAPAGLAAETVAEDERNSRVILGTPRYMAPELFRRQPVDPRVDLYALGVMLYEILAGTPPYPGDDPRQVMKGHLKTPIPMLRARDGVTLPPDLERCIYTLLAKDPAERYQTAAEVRQAFQQVLQGFSYAPWSTSNPSITAHDMGPSTSGLGLNTRGGETIPPPMGMMGKSRPGAAYAAEAPLVGRRKERRAIEHRLLRTLRENEGGLISVEGPQGIGKTRLVQWLSVRVEEAGLMRVVQGSFGRSGGGFGGIRSILDELFGSDDFDYNDLPYVIESVLTRWGFSSDEIEATVRLMRPGGEELLLEPEDDSNRRVSERERVFATIERIFRRVAEDRPLLVVLEDLHESGEAAIGFLEHLVVGLYMTPAPIMMVSTARSDELANDPRMQETFDRLARFGNNNVLRLRLGKLSDEEAIALVMKILPIEKSSAARIAERSAGTPLHILQIMRYLQDSGALVFADGSWTLKDDTTLMDAVPDEMADMMRYRADRFCQNSQHPHAARAILNRCAVLGQRFDYGLLRIFFDSQQLPRLLQVLDIELERLVRDGIFREIGHSGEDILEFDHSIMRDVLLADLEQSDSDRGTLHKLAAEAKIRFYGDRVNEYALDIAEHYRQAGQSRGVYRFVLKSARAAMAASDLKRAMELFREAEAIGDVDEILQEERTLMENSTVLGGPEVGLQVAHLERRLGEYDSAREDYQALLDSNQPHVLLWAQWGLGEIAKRQGNYNEAAEWFEAASKGLDESRGRVGLIDPNDHELIEAHTLYGLGHLQLLRGQFTGSDKLLAGALERAQHQRERLLEADILRALAEVHWRRGKDDTSEVYRRRAAMLVNSFGDGDAKATNLFETARYHHEAGEQREAARSVRAAEKRYDELGKRHQVAACLLLMGNIARVKGDKKVAAQCFRKSHRYYESFQDRRGLADCKFHLAELAMAIGRLADTQSLVKDALSSYGEMGNRRGEALCWMLIARLDRQLERHGNAATRLSDAVERFEVLGDIRSRISALALQSLVFEELGEPQSADQCINEVLRLLQEIKLVNENLIFAFRELSILLMRRRPEVAGDIQRMYHELAPKLGAEVEG